jgi:hypothetical protein
MRSLDRSEGLALHYLDYADLAVPLDAVCQGQHLSMLLRMIPETKKNAAIQ